MRQALSVLLMVLAGLLCVASLAGYQVNQLLREEEPIREIAGELPAQPEFSEAVGEAMVQELTTRLPDQVQGALEGRVGSALDQAASSAVSSLMDNDRMFAAWDQTLQQTRSGYADQLEELFHTGTEGDPSELNVELELSPVADAVAEPLREFLQDYTSWIPGIDEETYSILAPEIVVDIEAASDEQADPYTWATAAAASQHWVAFAIAAAAAAALGLLLGPGRWRWIGLAAGAATAAGLGLWIALTAASPSFESPAGMPQATGAVLSYVQSTYTAWAQPSWWVFTGASAFLLLLGTLVAVVVRPQSQVDKGRRIDV